jgi:uncharacterized protein YjbI with pentapeptide repeats
MKIFLLVFSLAIVSQVSAADSYLCESNQSKGACINYEIKGRLRVKELPDDLSFSTFARMSIPGTLKNKNLRGAELQEADLVAGTATDSDFIRANLKGFQGKDTNFSRSLFDSADLRGGKFYRAKFVHSSFLNADLREADLSFCDFSSSDLRGADLSGSWVLGANFQGAKIDSNTKLPFSISTAYKSGMISDEKLVDQNN